MAWVSRFSGLPANTDAPTGSDSYASGTGVFTIDTFTGSDRKFNDPSSSQAPIAYETLASIGASVSAVLRVTTRWVGPFPPNFEVLPCGIGPILYEAANRLDAINATFDGDDVGNGLKDGFAYENSNTGLQIGGGSVPYSGASLPFQARIYWNGTGSAFIIPDAGFSSWSVAANTVSVWHTIDDGTTWIRLGDRAIAGSIVPDRVGAMVYASGVIPIGGTDTLTLGTLEVMEEVASGTAPVMGTVTPTDLSTGIQLLEPISVEITDVDDDLDVSTVVITVEGVVAWTSDAPANGWQGSKTAITNGYRYDLTEPPWPYPKNTVINVSVVADDVGANGPLNDSFSFTSAVDESVKPALANEDPQAGSVAASDTDITVDVVDAGVGVDPFTVKLYVNNVLAWQSRTSQAGYTVTETKITNGYRYVITPSGGLPQGRVRVRVVAEDLA